MIHSLKVSARLGLALALMGLPAAAQSLKPGDKDWRLEEAFGSTIVSTFADSRQGELWLQRDGGYTAMGRRHNLSSGTWQVRGDKLCLHQHAPFPAPFSFCTPVPVSGLDKPWPARSPTGDPITIRLVKGIYGRDPPGREGAEAGREGGPKG
jgi:hypothetical protein